MQYLITEDERNNLVPVADLNAAKEALKLARGEILAIAGFTCHHEADDPNYDYCDDCPCSPLKFKDYKVANLICGLSKNYSQ